MRLTKEFTNALEKQQSKERRERCNALSNLIEGMGAAVRGAGVGPLALLLWRKWEEVRSRQVDEAVKGQGEEEVEVIVLD